MDIIQNKCGQNLLQWPALHMPRVGGVISAYKAPTGVFHEHAHTQGLRLSLTSIKTSLNSLPAWPVTAKNQAPFFLWIGHKDEAHMT